MDRTRAAAARIVELTLAIGGLGYTVLGSESEGATAIFLLAWSAVALTYLGIGVSRVRRQRWAPPDEPPPPSGYGRRLSFFTTVAASLTGLGAALDVLAASDDTELGPVVTGLGVVVVICAWLLLSLGYARFYATWSDWRFPNTPHPRIVDFLYFSVTIGVSFATSDVEVLGRALRWHVMVHSVVAFFYNAIVLAVALSVIRAG